MVQLMGAGHKTDCAPANVVTRLSAIPQTDPLSFLTGLDASANKCRFWIIKNNKKLMLFVKITNIFIILFCFFIRIHALIIT